MEKKLKQFLDDAFKPYGDFPARADVTQELLANLVEKYNDLKKQGKGDDEAYQLTVDSFGDASEIMEQVQHDATPPSREGKESAASKSAPKSTDLRQADLTDSNLAGKDFSTSALTDVAFDRSDLHGSRFKAAALSGASFAGANLQGAVFIAADLQNVNFNKADLTNAKFTATNLKGATLDGTIFVNAEFSKSDLSGIAFDGADLEGVVFNKSSLDKATFKGAVLRNVTFHHTAVKHAIFDGATMDKLTYALLKSAKATLTDVSVQ